MTDALNEQELMEYIVARTGVGVHDIEVVLRHEQTFINSAKANAKGEVEIDSDDLVDYLLNCKAVTLDEIKVEAILDAEMDYLMDHGLAGYID